MGEGFGREEGVGGVGNRVGGLRGEGLYLSIPSSCGVGAMLCVREDSAEVSR